MKVLDVRNVIEALPTGLQLLSKEMNFRRSRGGAVFVYPGPVTTRYRRPMERVLFWPVRDANPFFHLHEALWMLGGRNDVKSVADYVKRMNTFSDDDVHLHAAYGFRWRKHFAFDQLDVIVSMLKEKPDHRQCVLQIWDAATDLDVESKDIPCNTQVYFSRNSFGHLEMTVCCRSNDIIWGAYGANMVHFSFLQEYMAAMIGCEVGSYWQLSNNYHAYLSTFEPLFKKMDGSDLVDPWADPYESKDVEPFPLFQGTKEVDHAHWHTELHAYLNDRPHTYSIPFFKHVAIPLKAAYRWHKSGNVELAFAAVQECQASDWRLAANEWLERRHQPKE